MPEDPASLRFGVLGPLSAARGDTVLHAGGPKQRAVLAMLLVEANRIVSVARLAEGLWGDDVPDRGHATLQVHVSNLRKALQLADESPIIVTRPPGYVMELGPDQLDLLGFKELTAEARSLTDVDPAAASERYEAALAMWRGPALEDLQHEPFAAPAVAWLEEERLRASEERLELGLRLGRERELVGEIEAVLARTPLSERLWRLLMLALYRSGRQADALAAYGRARETLLDQLGLEPSVELRETEGMILRQDPALDRVADDPAAVPSPPAGMASTIRAARIGEAALVMPDGARLPLSDRPYVIGRQEGCDLVLADPAVSRLHAEIRPALGGHLLIDNGSTNGTAVNDRPVAQCVLEDGDVIVIGALTLTYAAGRPPA
jgi:DNA-binding SARP family transcriptional activator